MNQGVDISVFYLTDDPEGMSIIVAMATEAETYK